MIQNIALKWQKVVPLFAIVCLVSLVFVTNFQKLDENKRKYYSIQEEVLRLKASDIKRDAKLNINSKQLKKIEQKIYSILKLNTNDVKGVDKQTQSSMNGFPSLDYEKSLRKIGQNMNDLWHNLKETLNSTQLKFFNELRYSLLTDLNIITERDNELRRERLESLNGLISDTITRLQNPKDCKTARKLKCVFSLNCGFGCLSHYWTNCLIASLALNRTLIIEDNMIYFKNFFKPLSQTCLDSGGDNRTTYDVNTAEHFLYQVVEMPTIWNFKDKGYPDYYPPKVPLQLSEELQELSGEPYVLFVGNLLRYLLRPNNEFTEYLLKFKKQIQFNYPIVGIHVRRTDKLDNEADYHPLDQYMSYAEDFFNKIDLTNERKGLKNKTKRVIYLATDEINVWNNEVKPWLEKGYQFLGDSKHANTARDVMSRFGEDSTRDLLTDLFMLSESDFIVCGISSTYCRSAVRLMHTRDPSLPYQTVDNPYLYSVQPYHMFRAISDNKGQDGQELSFSTNDVIAIDRYDLRMDSYYKYGYRYGKLLDNNKMTKIPNFKIEEFVETYSSIAFENSF